MLKNTGTKENGYKPEDSIFGKKSDSGRTTAGFLDRLNNKNHKSNIAAAIAEAVKNEGFEKLKKEKPYLHINKFLNSNKT